MRQTASLLLVLLCYHAAAAGFRLTVLHFNDFHARFEQTSVRSAACKAADSQAGKCYGGLARMFQAVQDIRALDQSHTLLLNAGDMYQVCKLSNNFKAETCIQRSDAWHGCFTVVLQSFSHQINRWI